MKRFTYAIPAIIALLSSCIDNFKEPEAKGSVWGIISLSTDARAYGAEILLEPGGGSTSTGSDGRYSIENLTPGSYAIDVKLKGCRECQKGTIIIEPNKQTEYSITLEVIPAKITFDPETLDFGEQDESRAFSIVHNSDLGPLKWHASYDCKWIKETNPAKDLDIVSEPGKTKTIKVTIDRNQLPFGNNETHILIISEDNGRAEIKVTASNTKRLPSSNMESVSDVTQHFASFVGTMTDIGSPAVNERGFVYSLSENPTINSTKVSASLTDNKSFSVSVNNLKEGTTYFVRTYTKSVDGVSYSNNELSFCTIGSYPGVSTKAINNVDVVANKATFVGEVVNEGNPAYGERGFCYNTTGNPTISEQKAIVSGRGKGEFSYECAGLKSNVTYFVRAYVIQEGKAYYGATLSFNTKVEDTKVTTSAATEVGAYSARLNGSIVISGTPKYTEKGFCYSSTNSVPTIKDTKKSVVASGDSNYSVVISGLNYNTRYYYRAYAIQAGKEIYGDVISFNTAYEKTGVETSAASNITANSAVLNGSISNVGIPCYTEKGFCIAESAMPTVNDTKLFVSGSSSGNFNKPVSGLDCNKTYYVRAYALQGKEYIYGNTVSFTLLKYTPELSTSAVSNIGATSATFNANVSVEGSPAYTERGFCYSKKSTPSISDNRIPVSGTGEGEYKYNISGLEYKTMYYVRAYVMYDGKPIYGNTVSFTTVWEDPVVQTLAATDIEAEYALLNGLLPNAGNPQCTECGFVYSTIRANPTISDTRIPASSIQSKLCIPVSGLTPTTPYHVRAYAIQNGAVFYGDPISFRTGTRPEVETLSVGKVYHINQINGTYLLFADLYGSVKNEGSPSYVEKGFVYKIEDLVQNTPPTYEYDSKVTVNTTGTGNFQTITGQLNHMEWYVVRAYVKMKSGKVYYGNVVNFDTWKYEEW